MESENEVMRMGIIKKRVNEFPTPYTCANAVKKGGLETKLSMVLMGLGNMVHGQIAKGLIYMAVEVTYVVFMAVRKRSGMRHSRSMYIRRATSLS